MIEKEEPQNQAKEVIKKEKKKQFFLIKIVIFITLIFFGYFGFKYWQHLTFQKLKAQIASGKFDNIDSDIFDLSSENQQSSEDDNSHDLSDITVNELKEKGAEFIYQTLLQNQTQINILKDQIQSLKADIIKNKNQEKLGRVIVSYLDLRQKFFNNQPYEDALKSFEILSSADETLQNKLGKLKPLLKKFSAKEKLNKDFANLIPNLIVTKNNNIDPSFIGKVRHNISKLIIIRRIDGSDADKVDAIIAKTEKFLREGNYQEALNSLLTLDQSYHQILANFLDNLSVAAEVQKIDEEIFNYLKSLT